MSLFNIKSGGAKYTFPRLPNLALLKPQVQITGGVFSFELNDFFGQNVSSKLMGQVFLVLVLMALVSTLSFQLWQHNAAIAEENALLELTQGVLLIFASCTLGARAWLARASDNLNKVIFLTLAFFFFAMFLREVDIDKLGRSPSWVGVERVIRSVAVLAIGAFMLSLLPKMKVLLANFFTMVKTPAVVITILACFLYAWGWFFDKEMFPISKSLSRCVEEIIELNACLLFALAALARGMAIRATKTI